MPHARRHRFCLALLLCLCSARLPAQETLRIGAEDDWYPYTAYRDGKVQGMSVDIVRAAFAASDTPVELVPYPYSRCMQMTYEGQLAGCFNTSPSHLSDERFLRPHEPLFSAEILLWAKKPANRSATVLQQLSGRRIAMTLGYEYGPYLDHNPNIVQVPVRRDLSGFLMLQRERVDFVAAYRDTAQALFHEHPELAGQFVPVATLHQTRLYLSLSRQHADAPLLMQRFDDGMRLIRSNGRYQQILEQWQHHNVTAL